MTVLAGIFAECGRVLKQRTGRMVFTFHHWDPQAWAELTIALKSAGFRLMNAYVVFSEHPISVHIRNLKSIKHDSILVFALDGDGPPVPWRPVEAIATDDSETFCRQCSAALGWLMASECSAAQIRTVWKELVQGSSSVELTNGVESSQRGRRTTSVGQAGTQLRDRRVFAERA
jgi:hypothetical protein